MPAFSLSTVFQLLNPTLLVSVLCSSATKALLLAMGPRRGGLSSPQRPPGTAEVGAVALPGSHSLMSHHRGQTQSLLYLPFTNPRVGP